MGAGFAHQVAHKNGDGATRGDEERELAVSRANSWISKYEKWHPWLKRFKAARDAASGDGPLLDFLVDSGVDPDQIVAPLIELREPSSSSPDSLRAAFTSGNSTGSPGSTR